MGALVGLRRQSRVVNFVLLLFFNAPWPPLILEGELYYLFQVSKYILVGLWPQNYKKIKSENYKKTQLSEVEEKQPGWI